MEKIKINPLGQWDVEQPIEDLGKNDDSIPKVEGMVTQVAPQKGSLAEQEPYSKRLPSHSDMSKPMRVDEKKQVTINDKPYEHRVIDLGNNHTWHMLRDQRFNNEVAHILTAKNGDVNHIRAAHGSIHPNFLVALRDSVMSDPKHKFEGPIELDASKHMEKGWEDHNKDLVHGLVPDRTIVAPPSGTITKWLSFAGRKGDNSPRVLAKEAVHSLDHERDWNPKEGGGTAEESYFDHPTFNTAHREGAYSKLAHDFFGMGDYVPKTAVFRHPLSDKTWSAQEFIPGGKHIDDDTNLQSQFAHMNGTGDLPKLALMNTILGNRDRHGGNMMFDKDNKVKLVDNGLSFDYNNVVSGKMPAYVEHHSGTGKPQQLTNEEVPEDTRKWLRGLKGDELHDHLIKMGAPPQVAKIAKERLELAQNWDKSTAGKKQELDENTLGHLIRRVIMPHKLNPAEESETLTPDKNSQLGSTVPVGSTTVKKSEDQLQPPNGELHVPDGKYRVMAKQFDQHGKHKGNRKIGNFEIEGNAVKRADGVAKDSLPSGKVGFDTAYRFHHSFNNGYTHVEKDQ